MPTARLSMRRIRQLLALHVGAEASTRAIAPWTAANAARLSKSRAATVRYDRTIDRIIVELSNGCTFAFPPRPAQGLGNATADQLAEVEILGTGHGLHWECT